MLDKSEDTNVVVHAEGQYHKHSQGIKEMLERTDIMVMIFMSVFVLFGGAIRLTRASLASQVESFHTYKDSDINIFRKTGIFYWILGGKGVCASFKSFWRKFPRRVWNFYIDAFLVPGYRKEWGKYDKWSFRSEQRPPKSKYVRNIIRAQKKRARHQQSEGDDNYMIPHNHASCQRIRINVSGVRYETQLRTLERFPDTLLGNAKKRVQYYDPLKQEYYFDRNRHAFEAILNFYQSGGRFKRPDNLHADVLLEEAQFYQLSRPVINEFRKAEGLSPKNTKHEIIPQSFLFRKIWLLFDFPESSIPAAYIAILSIGALIVSIGIFCVETIQVMESGPKYGVNKEGRVIIIGMHSLNIHDPFFFTDTICNVWFILEFLTRLICCPFVWKFLKDPLNIIDMIAILPFMLSVAATPSVSTADDDGEGTPSNATQPTNATDSLYLLRIVRVIRIFRIFKLSRHSRGLKILGKTLKASLNELILLIFFIVLGVLMFSSAMYFAEIDNPDSKFDSIPGGFWWAIITITTVGFGDVVPQTILGRVVGALCAVAGVLTIALPVPVIVSNFNFFCHQSIDEGDLKWIHANHVSACPFRPAGHYTETRKGQSSRKAQVYSSDEEFGTLKKIS